MLKVLVAAILAVSSPVYAHETDSAGPTPEQISKAQELPQTVVVRTSKADPSKVEVIQVKEKLEAGRKLSAEDFQRLAAATDSPRMAYDSSNELDMTSSKNSWAFGLALGLGAGLFLGSAYTSGAYASYYSPYSYGGYYRPAYAYSPYYSYAGYSYAYRPYYSYSTPAYNYSYCGWNGGYGGYYGYGGY